jgi:TolB protein
MVGLTPGPGTVYGRQYTIELPEVTAPFPALNALAIEPFLALRQRTLSETSWDVLSDLENMFIPLTSRLPPGRSSDWLYTGRAFALNRVLIELGWMKVVREDIGGQTYWRIFLRPLNQDGSQGRPMTQQPWDFSARFSGNTTAYEEGGAREGSVPAGYWIDFTALALDHGWERQPALANWRSFLQGARYNVFAVTSGLTWEEAMLQLYPPEIFMDPISPSGSP